MYHFNRSMKLYDNNIIGIRISKSNDSSGNYPNMSAASVISPSKYHITIYFPTSDKSYLNCGGYSWNRNIISLYSTNPRESISANTPRFITFGRARVQISLCNRFPHMEQTNSKTLRLNIVLFAKFYFYVYASHTYSNYRVNIFKASPVTQHSGETLHWLGVHRKVLGNKNFNFY